MVVRKKKMIINGQEFEIEFFDTKIKPGKEVAEDTVDKLLEEEAIEKSIHTALDQIREIRKKYDDIEKNLEYHYEVGKVMQFIDKERFIERHGNRSQIFERMAIDLDPKLFFGDRELKKEKSLPRLEYRRVIEKMYLLGKFSHQDLQKATWNQWDEIYKFKGLAEQKAVLKKVFECCAEGMSSVTLRRKIKELRSKAK